MKLSLCHGLPYYIRNTTNLFYVYVYSPYYLLLDLFLDFLYFDPRLLLHLLYLATDEGLNEMSEENHKRERTSVRKAITMSINTTRVYINDTEKDNYETSLKGIVSSIRAKLIVSDKLDSKLICTCFRGFFLCTCAEEEIDKETTDANNYQTNIYVCLSEIDTALERLREPIIPLSRTHSPSQFSSNS